jgi:predicted dehydrogenase
MRDKLKTLLIGTGAISQLMHLPNLATNKRVTLEMVCDLNADAAEASRVKFGARRTSTDWRAAVADDAVELVVLATTEKLRRPVIELCAKLGKPIYVEKPLATSLSEMYLIQKAVKASGIPFCVGHNRRSAPAMIEAHAIFRAHMEAPKACPWRWMREKELPGLHDLPEAAAPGMSVRINDDWRSWKAWVFDKTQAPHGPMLFEMTHFTDLCNWFMGQEPVSVTAIEAGMLSSGVVVRYANQGLATIQMCANGTFGYTKELYEVMGQGGIVVVDHMLEVRTAGIEGAPAKKTYPMIKDRHPGVGTQGGFEGWFEKKQAACREAAAAGDPMLQFTAEPDKGHGQAMDRFIDQILGIGPELCGVDSAVSATEVAFAAIKSAQVRREVTIEEIRAGAASGV